MPKSEAWLIVVNKYWRDVLEVLHNLPAEDSWGGSSPVSSVPMMMVVDFSVVLVSSVAGYPPSRLNPRRAAGGPMHELL
jgi:hypothetical protein